MRQRRYAFSALREAATAREAIAEVLRHNVVAFSARTSRIAERRLDTECGFRQRIERGVVDGDVPAGVDAGRLRRFTTR
jgi:hypothetical protein